MAARYRSFTALWLGGAGDLVATYPYARQGIWYGQSQSGIDYPLVTPSDDVRYLLADAYLSYSDPADYGDSSEFTLPFRIYWLFGFGDVAGDAPDEDMPVPSNPRDIIIVDADNTTVFDSTVPGILYESRDWTQWLHITRWARGDGAVCSIVHYTAWGYDTTPQSQTYPEYFFPDAAVLQEQAVYRLPKQVRSITAILDVLTGKNVLLAGGYNMGLTLTTAVTSSGKRRISGITFDSSPGGGDGLYPDCTPTDTPIRTINAVAPTSTGHFFFNAAGCYYVRQPMRLLSSTPRTLLPETHLTPGSVAEVDLPDDAAGTDIAAAGWPADTQYAHLQVGNDCGACCDCEDYLAVEEYIRTQHGRYKLLGTSLSSTRDQYHDNRLRWLEAKECLQQSPVRVVVQAQQCPYVDIGVQICNQTDQCMTDIAVAVAISTVPAGGIATLMRGYTYTTGPTIEGEIQRITTKRSAIDVIDNTFSSVVEQLTPGSSSIVRFRLSVAECGGADIFDTGYQVLASATASTNGIAINTTPATDADILNCPPTVTIPAPHCIRC